MKEEHATKLDYIQIWDRYRSYVPPPAELEARAEKKRQEQEDWAHLAAQKEHAWLLRAEGLSLFRIGLRLGMPRSKRRGYRASHVEFLIQLFAKRMQKAVRYANLRRVK